MATGKNPFCGDNASWMTGYADSNSNDGHEATACLFDLTVPSSRRLLAPPSPLQATMPLIMATLSIITIPTNALQFTVLNLLDLSVERNLFWAQEVSNILIIAEAFIRTRKTESAFQQVMIERSMQNNVRICKAR